EQPRAGRLLPGQLLQCRRAEAVLLHLDARAIGDADDGDVEAELIAEMFLLRGQLRGELAPDLTEAEERELRLASRGVGERMNLVELILAVQRLQRAIGIVA